MRPCLSCFHICEIGLTDNAKPLTTKKMLTAAGPAYTILTIGSRKKLV